MNKTIYVFAGKANAGKDTAASMACYIARVGTARANYKNWENYATAQKIALRHKNK